MLSDFLEDNINFLNSVDSWEQAIEIAAAPLLEEGSITSKYIQNMISNVNHNGPYIVIVPGIAMPHARNDGGVLKTGMSFLKLKTPVIFPSDKKVYILFVLAAEDGDGHMKLISELSSLLCDEEAMEKFKRSENKEEIIDSIKMVE